jgi:membrane-bound lytic murein transglycosylase
MSYCWRSDGTRLRHFEQMSELILFAAASGTLEQIKELGAIATPIALIISIVMQKLEGNKAHRAAEAAELDRLRIAEKLEKQKTAQLEIAKLVEQQLEQRAKELNDKLEAQNRETIRAAKEVKDSLTQATVAQQIKMEEIHVDVNSKMGAQKKKTWEFALALAQRPGADSTDQANARAAEKDYLDHMEAQARADERVKMVKERALKAGTIPP